MANMELLVFVGMSLFLSFLGWYRGSILPTAMSIIAWWGSAWWWLISLTAAPPLAWIFAMVGFVNLAYLFQLVAGAVIHGGEGAEEII